MTESNDVKPVKPQPKSGHDAPRSHTLREKRNAMMFPSFESSFNVAQTVRSLGNEFQPVWQRIEITNCTDLACPLYAYRPYRIPAAGKNQPLNAVESTNSPVPLPRQGVGLKC